MSTELDRAEARPRSMRLRSGKRLTVALTAVLLVVVACTHGGGGGHVTTADQAARLALAQQARFAGIGARDDSLIGQADWYRVSASADGWEVLIRIGWADCPAGCINEHRWTYHIGGNGSIALVRDTGDPLPNGTGVSGTVTAGPTCPVVTNPPDPACAERPVAGAVLVIRDRGGSEVGRVTTAQDGSFAFQLAPGSYQLIPQPVKGLMGTAAPIDVRVEAGQPMTEVHVSYDTGIR
jgi:hypothetical protein